MPSIWVLIRFPIFSRLFRINSDVDAFQFLIILVSIIHSQACEGARNYIVKLVKQQYLPGCRLNPLWGKMVYPYKGAYGRELFSSYKLVLKMPVVFFYPGL